ncbi:hypothetical protein METBIDRAFT_31860 [Metschnikowia bicuspidata var. bicuspidata NRRL YB-4993]|uniref:Uncharacterized protein n=1 Tax=Metschnikowia bicuspidata var. bicuspidata NRRL YB-4993 TaxID=869754 RepID=A0A1A0HBR4_9ASCO|nr:hypothetical protein METBIDRAFT_31860 [Metschnikowia bicuspidata var. bicuspidata NRRL YB-4993]OBA21317.1 hypothetical protein METBIDRAFT_31860 [Metschnikowia bicuspidata var. bicuspidata NRRL YB-4993]
MAPIFDSSDSSASETKFKRKRRGGKSWSRKSKRARNIELVAPGTPSGEAETTNGVDIIKRRSSHIIARLRVAWAHNKKSLHEALNIRPDLESESGNKTKRGPDEVDGQVKRPILARLHLFISEIADLYADEVPLKEGIDRCDPFKYQFGFGAEHYLTEMLRARKINPGCGSLAKSNGTLLAESPRSATNMETLEKPGKDNSIKYRCRGLFPVSTESVVSERTSTEISQPKNLPIFGSPVSEEESLASSESEIAFNAYEANLSVEKSGQPSTVSFDWDLTRSHDESEVEKLLDHLQLSVAASLQSAVDHSNDKKQKSRSASSESPHYLNSTRTESEWSVSNKNEHISDLLSLDSEHGYFSEMCCDTGDRDSTSGSVIIEDQHTPMNSGRGINEKPGRLTEVQILHNWLKARKDF